MNRFRVGGRGRLGSRLRAGVLLAFALCIASLMMASCAVGPSGDDVWSGRVTHVEGSVGNAAPDGSVQDSASDIAAGSNEAPAPSESLGSSSGEAAQVDAAVYPTGWLAVEESGVPAGTAVQVLYTPKLAASGRVDGEQVPKDQDESMRASWDFSYEDRAVVSYGSKVVPVDPDALLVNVPDFLPDAVCDIVYSYAATSRCAGEPIAGVTDRRIEGYADGMQRSAYWGEDRYVVPCAYGTAVKLAGVSEALANQGWRLLVYDAYRPMRAQLQMSDAFEAAYQENEVIQASLGDWPIGWYVASGSSGHNFGTDVDVGLCDESGRPVEMPSAFDAFDESGHLTDSPMASGDIQPENYCEAVRANDACLALHRAFCGAGFSELASEWWHFADEETESAVRAIAGDDGLDFVAEL